MLYGFLQQGVEIEAFDNQENVRRAQDAILPDRCVGILRFGFSRRSPYSILARVCRLVQGVGGR
jgi:hypothetical protein